MKKSKFIEAQIVFAIKQAETGTPVNEVCRKMGISEAEYCRKSDGRCRGKLAELVAL